MALNEDPTPATPEEPPAERARRRPRLPRWFVYPLTVFTAVVAALIVTFFTVDVARLWPGLKAEAEKRGSAYLARKMTIGRIHAKVTPGVFQFDDVVIEGLQPTDRPFLKARKLTVSLPWWTIFSKELIVESLEMTDWEMVVESFVGGRNNFPRVNGPPRDPTKPRKPRWFKTTMRNLLASRGHVTYVDHGTPWTVVAPNMRVTLFRRVARDDYGGTAS
ncbi:MAG: hypothetical protein H0W08_01280, partial [Acidobacteria bacterium]|nr:hypothetical protein [Acidobacteriota bacterium]